MCVCGVPIHLAAEQTKVKAPLLDFEEALALWKSCALLKHHLSTPHPGVCVCVCLLAHTCVCICLRRMSLEHNAQPQWLLKTVCLAYVMQHHRLNDAEPSPRAMEVEEGPGGEEQSSKGDQKQVHRGESPRGEKENQERINHSPVG